jgi:hypothetical protein
MRSFMKTTIGLFVLSMLAVSPGVAETATCRRLSPVESIDNVSGFYLVLQSRHSYYVVNESCANLRRGDFPRKIQFKILPPGTGDQTTVFIRSYRILAQPQQTPIKMSRGGDWLMPDAKTATDVPLAKLKDEPFQGSASDWDAAHASAGSPEEFSGRLHTPWHAYAGPGGALPSTIDLWFWKTSGKYDLDHATLTNYLLTFPAKSQTPIPFDVALQDAVSEITLTISSREESLNGTYKFIIRD